ncbi:MAG: hypothetical protein HXX11_16475 [Desulfuromonadales bacterium]|nr:hypothetical protein [Desulfuromonadales bacterium]
MREEQHKYIRRFIEASTGLSGVDLSNDLAERIFESLTLARELVEPGVDSVCNWTREKGSLAELDESKTAWIDRELRSLAAVICPEADNAKHRTVWPENKPFALCLTHDVDFVTNLANATKLYRRLSRLAIADGPRYLPLLQAAGSLIRLVTCIGKSDSLGHYEDWMKLEEKYGFKSTFYFFSFPGENLSVYDCDYKLNDSVTFDGIKMSVSEMMRTIDSAGWEIGLHGSYNSSENSFLLSEQKAALEHIIQKEIISNRNHYLKFNALVTPQIQAEVGIRNDSTQGFNRFAGFRAGTSFPYWCWNHREGKSLPLLEIPMALMDVALFRNNSTQQDADKALATSIRTMDEVESVGGCLTLNWHPNYLNNDVYWQSYVTLLQEASRRNAWGCSAGELYNWWTEREQAATA